jgi:hypothetical protein
MQFSTRLILILSFLYFSIFVTKWVFKSHGLKFQNVLFPNGRIAGVIGAAGSHNDVGVLNVSGLLTTQHFWPILSSHLFCKGREGFYLQC